MAPKTIAEFEHPHIESPNAEIKASVFNFAPFFSNVSSVLLTSFLIVCLTLVFPWTGGPASGGFAFLYYLTVVVSLYSFARGYVEIFKRGFAGWDLFLWIIAILVTIGVTIDIVIFGSVLLNSPISFSGSDIFTSPVVFFLLVILQALYFLIESIVVSLFIDRHNTAGVRNWYLAMYLFILSINSAAVVTGLLIYGYSRVLL